MMMSHNNIEDDEENEANLDAKTKRRRQCFKHMGFYLILPVILGLVALMLLSVMVRASIDDTNNVDDINNADADADADDDGTSVSWFSPWRNVNLSELEVSSFNFLGEYNILLCLSWFVYFPMVVTILFSGILGCGGKVPVLGGRPYDKARVDQALRKGNRNHDQNENVDVEQQQQQQEQQQQQQRQHQEKEQNQDQDQDQEQEKPKEEQPPSSTYSPPPIEYAIV